MTQSRNWTTPREPASGVADVNHAGAHHHNFGEEHHHKPTKTIIGVSVLILLSFLLYEINYKSVDTHSSSSSQQMMAMSNR
ncbi:MAG: hypothetical protein H7312_19435 [Tardiphaga sp.]|nr:hypothetical protein [Tardiphaga sp.]